MSDLVGNPEDWFSHNEAHIVFVAASSLGPGAQTPTPADSYQPQQPGVTGYAPGDETCTARQCHQYGIMAGRWRLALTWKIKLCIMKVL